MVNTILARRVNHNCSQRGQSCLAKRVKVAWLFQPHRKHLYQLMANELRIPHVTVSLVYMTVQGLVNVGYLACPSEYGYMYLAGTVVVLSGVYVWFMKKYFRLHAFRS